MTNLKFDVYLIFRFWKVNCLGLFHSLCLRNRKLCIFMKQNSHVLLRNVKLSRGVLKQTNNLCIFPCRLLYAKFPAIPPVTFLFWSILFEGDCQSVKVFRVEFLALKHPFYKHLPKISFEKFSMPNFLITITCDSLKLKFFIIIPSIKHTATYFATWILKDFKF